MALAQAVGAGESHGPVTHCSPVHSAQSHKHTRQERRPRRCAHEHISKVIASCVSNEARTQMRCEGRLRRANGDERTARSGPPGPRGGATDSEAVWGHTDRDWSGLGYSQAIAHLLQAPAERALTLSSRLPTLQLSASLLFSYSRVLVSSAGQTNTQPLESTENTRRATNWRRA